MACPIETMSLESLEQLTTQERINVTAQMKELIRLHRVEAPAQEIFYALEELSVLHGSAEFMETALERKREAKAACTSCGVDGCGAESVISRVAEVRLDALRCEACDGDFRVTKHNMPAALCSICLEELCEFPQLFPAEAREADAMGQSAVWATCMRYWAHNWAMAAERAEMGSDRRNECIQQVKRLDALGTALFANVPGWMPAWYFSWWHKECEKEAAEGLVEMKRTEPVAAPAPGPPAPVPVPVVLVESRRSRRAPAMPVLHYRDRFWPSPRAKNFAKELYGYSAYCHEDAMRKLAAMAHISLETLLQTNPLSYVAKYCPNYKEKAGVKTHGYGTRGLLSNTDAYYLATGEHRG
jgi:hypothetical protein